MKGYSGLSYVIISCVLILVLTAAGLEGCNASKAGADKDLLDIPDDIEAVMVEDYTPPVVELEIGIPGKVSFQPDESKSSTLEYTMDGKEKVLELTDGAGLTWSLKIPPNALSEPCEIKITALNNVSCDNFGDMKGGVRLEPDGLQFYRAAELTVTGPGLEKNGLLLSSNQEGDELNYTAMVSNKDQVVAKINHFSNAYVAKPSDNRKKEIEKDILKKYKEAEKAAKELLKRPLQVPPPPRIPIPECVKDLENNPEIEDTVELYYKMVLEPEKKVFSEIYTLNNAYQTLTAQNMNNSREIMKKIAERWEKKVQLLIERYKPQEEYFLPVVNVALKISAGMEILSGESATAEEGMQVSEPAFYAEIKDWANEISDKFLEEIRKEHRYKRVSSYLYIRKSISIMSIESDAQEDMQKLKDALTFELVIEENATIKGAVPGGSLENFYFNVEGKIEGLSVVNPEDTSQFAFKGSTEMEYKNVRIPSPGDEFIHPNKFTANAWVSGFNPCEDKVTILVDKFGAQTEPRIANGQRMNYPGTVQNVTAGAFKDKEVTNEGFLELIGAEGSVYEFPMTLQNGNIYAAEDTFHGSALFGSTVRYTLKLIHTPK